VVVLWYWYRAGVQGSTRLHGYTSSTDIQLHGYTSSTDIQMEYTTTGFHAYYRYTGVVQWYRSNTGVIHGYNFRTVVLL
jgi:hypothetical protein